MSNNTEHRIFSDIAELLQADGCWYVTFVHDKLVRTSEEADALRPGYTLAEGTKALIVRLKTPGIGKSFAMAVLPGDKKFDSKKLKTAAGANDLRFATEAEVAEITDGVQPGGVPPFGNLFGIAVYADSGVFAHKRMILNAGRDASIALFTDDYKRIVQPVIADIV